MSSENTNLNINIVETVENMMAELDTHFNDMLGDNPSTPPVMPVLTTPPPAPRRERRAEVEDEDEVKDKDEVNAVQCAVCYTDLTLGNCVITDCNHEFCNTCFFRWMKTKQTCPCCRKKFISPIDMEEHWNELSEENRDLMRENQTLRRLERTLNSRVKVANEKLVETKAQSKRACLRMARINNLINENVNDFKDCMDKELTNINSYSTLLNKISTKTDNLLERLEDAVTGRTISKIKTKTSLIPHQLPPKKNIMARAVNITEDTKFVGSDKKRSHNGKHKYKKVRRKVKVVKKESAPPNIKEFEQLTKTLNALKAALTKSKNDVVSLAKEINIANNYKIKQANLLWENTEMKSALNEKEEFWHEDPYLSVPELRAHYRTSARNATRTMMYNDGSYVRIGHTRSSFQEPMFNTNNIRFTRGSGSYIISTYSDTETETDTDMSIISDDDDYDNTEPIGRMVSLREWVGDDDVVNTGEFFNMVEQASREE